MFFQPFLNGICFVGGGILSLLGMLVSSCILKSDFNVVGDLLGPYHPICVSRPCRKDYGVLSFSESRLFHKKRPPK